MTFEALSHGFSHGCLRFVPSSRTTTQNSLPLADRPLRVGFSIPAEFVWRVSHFRAPLSQGFSWREAILILRNAAVCEYVFSARRGLVAQIGNLSASLEIVASRYDLLLVAALSGSVALRCIADW